MKKRQSNISFPSTLSQDEWSNDDMASHSTVANNDTAHSNITNIIISCLQGMVQTVKTFPLRDQIKIKG
jgi:hypothetical protein